MPPWPAQQAFTHPPALRAMSGSRLGDPAHSALASHVPSDYNEYSGVHCLAEPSSEVGGGCETAIPHSGVNRLSNFPFRPKSWQYYCTCNDSPVTRLTHWQRAERLERLKWWSCEAKELCGGGYFVDYREVLPGARLNTQQCEAPAAPCDPTRCNSTMRCPS